MADNASEYGFRWKGSFSGKSEPKPQVALVASGYDGEVNSTNVDINPGDPITLLSTGYVALAALGDPILGICSSILPYYNGSAMTPGGYLPNGTTYGTVFERQSKIEYIPAADAIFEIDCDDAVTATTYAAYLALVGENCDHVLTTGIQPKANPLLDISGHLTTTMQWRIVGISPTLANIDFSGARVKLYVTVNETQQAPYVTAGI